MASNGSANGNRRRLPLRPGLYAPSVTIFQPDTEELDLESQKKHTVRLAQAGLVGIVAFGSNGEAAHLSVAERALVVKTMREALDEAGFSNIPVIAGGSADSVKESVSLCHMVAEAGASYAMILPPHYYRPQMSPDVIFDFFQGVASKSPIGVLMYNFPAVTGVDMDSDLMIKIATRCPNVVGAKLTCGSTGKLTRVATATKVITEKKTGSFLVTGGMADMTIPTASCGGSGIIAGSANVFPKSCVKVWNLWHEGKQEEALELQKLVANADWQLAKSVVPSTKATLRHYFGYGGLPRSPLSSLQGPESKGFVDGIAEIMKIEQTL